MSDSYAKILKTVDGPLAEATHKLDLAVRHIARLEAALESLPMARQHDTDLDCPVFRGGGCDCGHEIIAKALGREPSSA